MRPPSKRAHHEPASRAALDRHCCRVAELPGTVPADHVGPEDLRRAGHCKAAMPGLVPGITEIFCAFYFPPSLAGASLAAGGAGFFWSSAAFFCAACNSSTVFCRAVTVPFSASVCALAASSFC
jgi:hypothetical protein